MASLGLVGGCTTDSPEPVTPSVSVPGVTATPSPTPTPTTPPEAVKPLEPEAVGLPGAEGAAAAAQYFLSLYPYVYATGDLAPWQAMSHPECVFCASVVTNVQAKVNAGQHTEGGLFELKLVSSALISADLAGVTLEVTESPNTVIGVDGDVVHEDEGGHYLMTLSVVPGDPWTVREVEYREISPAGS